MHCITYPQYIVSELKEAFGIPFVYYLRRFPLFAYNAYEVIFYVTVVKYSISNKRFQSFRCVNWQIISALNGVYSGKMDPHNLKRVRKYNFVTQS